MGTQHTPRVIDVNNTKQALLALKGSVEDLFMVVNALEVGLAKINSGFAAARNVLNGNSAAITNIVSTPPYTPDGIIVGSNGKLRIYSDNSGASAKIQYTPDGGLTWQDTGFEQSH
jgi:hypothetical protein